MFREVLRSPSGGQIVGIEHMVPSLSVSVLVVVQYTESHPHPEDEHNTARNM